MGRGAVEPEAIAYRPIDVIHSPFRQKAGMPIQGVFAPEAQGTVEVFDRFADGLGDLEMFSHVYLLYAFDRAEDGPLICVPFLDDRPHGVFATRAPRRPNAIGLSIVRLLAREGTTLRVAEVDVLDGTPLLDLKPYIPRIDLRPDASSGWVRNERHQAISDGADNRFGA